MMIEQFGLVLYYYPNKLMFQADIATLLFFAWIVLSVYYIARWVIGKGSSHQNSTRTAKKRI
jgi:hypothetical protein